jgi:hypothetical protein
MTSADAGKIRITTSKVFCTVLDLFPDWAFAEGDTKYVGRHLRVDCYVLFSASFNPLILV